MKGWKLGALALATAACASSLAQASITINDTADDFSVLWQYSPSAGGTISVTGDFDVTAITATQLVLNVKLTNNSSGFTNAGITSFGFNISPNVTPSPTAATATTVGSPNDTATDFDRFDGAAFNNLPAVAAIDICLYAGNNCNGGPQGQLLGIGEHDYFQIVITGNFPGSTVDFLDVTSNNVVGTGLMGLKVQTSSGSFELTGNTVPPNGGDPPLPTPGIAALLGLGLLGLARRRK